MGYVTQLVEQIREMSESDGPNTDGAQDSKAHAQQQRRRRHPYGCTNGNLGKTCRESFTTQMVEVTSVTTGKVVRIQSRM